MSEAQVKAELDVFQMCVGNFIVESEVELTCDNSQVYQILAAIDFGAFEIGRLDVLLETEKDAFSECFDFYVLIAQENFFSIGILINMISVMETEGVDITSAVFMADLDALVTPVEWTPVSFWSFTEATFSFDFFATFLVEINLEVSVLIEGLQVSGDFIACFGPGAAINAGVCECTIALTVFDSATYECGCQLAVDEADSFLKINDAGDECVCDTDALPFSSVNDNGICVQPRGQSRTAPPPTYHPVCTVVQLT